MLFFLKYIFVHCIIVLLNYCGIKVVQESDNLLKRRFVRRSGMDRVLNFAENDLFIKLHVAKI